MSVCGNTIAVLSEAKNVPGIRCCVSFWLLHRNCCGVCDVHQGGQGMLLDRPGSLAMHCLIPSGSMCVAAIN